MAALPALKRRPRAQAGTSLVSAWFLLVRRSLPSDAFLVLKSTNKASGVFSNSIVEQLMGGAQVRESNSGDKSNSEFGKEPFRF
jgi:hypothetical protein